MSLQTILSALPKDSDQELHNLVSELEDLRDRATERGAPFDDPIIENLDDILGRYYQRHKR